MKSSSLRLLLSVITAMLCLGILPLHADLRTLTDKLGRSIKADVISVENGIVKIRRDDGQTFEMPLTALSEEDQRALKDWALKMATHIPEGAIKVELSRGVFTSSKRDDISSVITEENWGYSVTISNTTFKPIKDLKFKYVLFVKPDAEPGKDPAGIKLKRSNGSSTLDEIAGNSRSVFRTDSIKIYKQKLKPGWIWGKTGGAEMLRDTLHGIWIKTYVGDQLIAETCTPEGLMQTEKGP